MNLNKKLRVLGFTLLTENGMSGKLTYATTNICFSVSLGIIDTLTFIVKPLAIWSIMLTILLPFTSQFIIKPLVSINYLPNSNQSKNILFGLIIMVKSFRNASIDSLTCLLNFTNNSFQPCLDVKCVEKSMNSRLETDVFEI